MVDTSKKLHRNEARKLILQIVKTGIVRFSTHGLKEMKLDGLTTNDVANVLAGGKIVEEGEFERGSWRYRVHTHTMCVVVMFPSDQALLVVTAWRKKK